MSGVLRLRLTIRGRVQGVWFREGTRQQAQRLGVNGWVKNCPDGSVEAVFEGRAELVRELEGWCSQGTPGARVIEVFSSEEAVTGEDGFRVLR